LDFFIPLFIFIFYNLLKDIKYNYYKFIVKHFYHLLLKINENQSFFNYYQLKWILII